MPWKDTSPVQERVKFIAAFLEGEENFSELCERFGISRKQGYKWKERYETLPSLKDYLLFSQSESADGSLLEDPVIGLALKRFVAKVEEEVPAQGELL